MTTEPRATLVEVEQVDREAAWALIIGEKVGAGDGQTYVGRQPTFQQAAEAFARHRLEALRTPADARSRFALAAAKIERGVRLSELTDAEIDSLVEALRTQGDGAMAAFGASDAACYLYPGEDQQREREAFCAGAAHASPKQASSREEG